MKKILLSMACLMAVLALSAQSTAKKFVLNLTADGESNLTCYLPQKPSGQSCRRLSWWRLFSSGPQS